MSAGYKLIELYCAAEGQCTMMLQSSSEAADPFIRLFYNRAESLPPPSDANSNGIIWQTQQLGATNQSTCQHCASYLLRV